MDSKNSILKKENQMLKINEKSDKKLFNNNTKNKLKIDDHRQNRIKINCRSSKIFEELDEDQNKTRPRNASITNLLKNSMRKISLKLDNKSKKSSKAMSLTKKSTLPNNNQNHQQKKQSISEIKQSKKRGKTFFKFSDISRNISKDNNQKAIWISKRGSINFHIMENQDYVIISEKNKNLKVYAILDGNGKHGRKIAEYLGNRILTEIGQMDIQSSEYKKSQQQFQQKKNENKTKTTGTIVQSKTETVLQKAKSSKAQNVNFSNKQEQEELKTQLFKKAITKIIIDQNTKMKKMMAKQTQNSGCTLIMIILSAGKIYCFNIGGSKGIMVKSKFNQTSQGKGRQVLTSFPLSTDQTLDRFDQKARIMSSRKAILEKSKDENGQRVGPLRIWKKGEKYPGIFITRCLGMSLSTQQQLGIICTPQIVNLPIDQNYKFVIIGSDGFWNAFSSTKQIITFLQTYWAKKQLNIGIQVLLNEAVRRWNQKSDLMDDITLMIIKL